MIDLMIDIETASHLPNACIVSIGAVEFDMKTGQTGKKFYLNVDLVSCQKAGLHISAETVLWWLKQNKESQLALEQAPVRLHTALSVLSDFIQECQPNNIWANSPSFDCVILKSAFNAVDIKCPWDFWQERCVRTLSAFRPDVRKNTPNDNAHDALADCLYQIKYCSVIYNLINI